MIIIKVISTTLFDYIINDEVSYRYDFGVNINTFKDVQIKK